MSSIFQEHSIRKLYHVVLRNLALSNPREVILREKDATHQKHQDPIRNCSACSFSVVGDSNPWVIFFHTFSVPSNIGMKMMRSGTIGCLHYFSKKNSSKDCVGYRKKTSHTYPASCQRMLNSWVMVRSLILQDTRIFNHQVGVACAFCPKHHTVWENRRVGSRHKSECKWPERSATASCPAAN